MMYDFEAEAIIVRCFLRSDFPWQFGETDFVIDQNQRLNQFLHFRLVSIEDDLAMLRVSVAIKLIINSSFHFFLLV